LAKVLLAKSGNPVFSNSHLVVYCLDTDFPEISSAAVLKKTFFVADVAQNQYSGSKKTKD
jgi:hypothetical protein